MQPGNTFGSSHVLQWRHTADDTAAIVEGPTSSGTMRAENLSRGTFQLCLRSFERPLKTAGGIRYRGNFLGCEVDNRAVLVHDLLVGLIDEVQDRLRLTPSLFTD